MSMLILLLIATPAYVALSIGAGMVTIASIISFADAPESREIKKWRYGVGILWIASSGIFPILALIGLIGGWIAYFSDAYMTARLFLFVPLVDVVVFGLMSWLFFWEA
jgi:hypothetical protein